MTEERDSGAFIGHEPELAAEKIPGGVRPQDERVAATQSEPAAPGEPNDAVDIIEGPIGSASLKEPAEVAADQEPADSQR